MNYSKFARIFNGDIWSTKVDTAEDFDKALKVTQIMNKLCYIEVCIDKMDIPALTKEVISDIKTAEMPIKNQKEEQLKKDRQKFKLPSIKDMNFGTTVHESLKHEDK